MKNLVIVESPTKVKTIEKILGKDYSVLSSYGHIRDLAKKDMSIDIANGYMPDYQIPEDKQKRVAELEKAVRNSECVWLASDEDREGEAIAWHLLETLKLDPAKTRRIVFNEITENAILYAIDHPRTIDMNLVNAQQARRVLDRLVGYEISPILWSKIKPALSAGRVQSVAVRLIVERENEIRDFKSQQYFRIVGTFATPTGNVLHADFSRRLNDEDAATATLQQMAAAHYRVAQVETKPTRRTPAPPFTTSTLQQEASRKLGYSVARTMQIAQQLYESGYITYMRTDSVNLSEVALNMAREVIGDQFGAKYVNIRHYHTKIKGAQEAHEAIRPTNLAVSSISGDATSRRLYELIWKRTIASQMADAELQKTTVNIAIDNMAETFVSTGEQILFDGFLKVYTESSDEEENETENSTLLPRVTSGDALTLSQADASQHFTQHPPRYTEATLIKKLEELGIGRPSTYAPTVSTILKREYVMKEDRVPQERELTLLHLANGQVERSSRIERVGTEKGKLFPTDIGTVVNTFLMEHFANIMDYNFTATVEKDFDNIAEGKKEWRNVIDSFYVPFHKNILTTQQTSKRSSGSRLVGVDPASGKNVYAKIGRYGTLIQIGDTGNDEKPRFASMKKGQSIENITLEEALALFELPRTVGTTDEGHEVVVSIGRFGPYVRLDGKFYSLGKGDDPYEVTMERCLEIVAAKQKADAEKERLRQIYPITIGEVDGDNVVANIGRFGPYLTYKKKNYRIPKDIDAQTLDLAAAKKIMKIK